MEGPGGDKSGRKEAAAGEGGVDAAVAAEEEAKAGHGKKDRQWPRQVGGAGGWGEPWTGL